MIEDIYSWYPTTNGSLPELCYSDTSCECQTDPGTAQLERNTTQGSVLLAKTSAANKGFAKTLAFKVTDSHKVTLASAMFYPPRPPRSLAAAFPNNVMLADLCKGPDQMGNPPTISGHHPWFPGWKIPWTPANGLVTHNNATRFVNVVGKAGNIPVKVLFGHMNFALAGNPKHEHSDTPPVAVGIEVTSIPNTIQNPQTITPEPANILSDYHAKIKIQGVAKDIDVLTAQPLR